MTIRFNGREIELPDGLTVLQMLHRLGVLKADVPPGRQGIAVERNRELVPGSRLGDEAVRSGDVFEVVTAFPGG